MPKLVCHPLLVAFGLLMSGAAIAQDLQEPIGAGAIGTVDISVLAAKDGAPDRPSIFPPERPVTERDSAVENSLLPNAAIVRLQVLLDQYGASPGVIDGYDGENVRKAVMAAQAMAGLPVSGIIDDALLGRLETGLPVIWDYLILPEDANQVTGPTPADYSDKALLDFLGYSSLAEALAERFHMDVNLFTALNPNAGFLTGETMTGPNAPARLHGSRPTRHSVRFGHTMPEACCRLLKSQPSAAKTTLLQVAATSLR